MIDQAKPKHYKDLLIWQKGMRLTKTVYTLTQTFPPDEPLGLTSQLRRASVSVPSNIAEGQARRGGSEFLQFLSITQGSLAEFERQRLLSVELGYSHKFDAKIALIGVDELQKMIVALRRKLSSYTPLGSRPAENAAGSH